MSDYICSKPNYLTVSRTTAQLTQRASNHLTSINHSQAMTSHQTLAFVKVWYILGTLITHTP